MARKVTCKPHPMSGLAESEGPIMQGPDEASIDLHGGGSKAMKDLVPGDMVLTYPNGPAFEVLTNEAV